MHDDNANATTLLHFPLHPRRQSSPDLKIETVGHEMNAAIGQANGNTADMVAACGVPSAIV